MTDLTIVFDLDGTLVDTAPDLAATLNHVLGESVLEPVDAATIRPLIGHGARLMLKSSLERAGKAVDDDRLDRLLARYLAHYRNHLADLSRPYPGAIDALRRFREKGVRLAICTNKYESLAKRLLAELAIDRFFDAITGADTFEVRKPHPGTLDPHNCARRRDAQTRRHGGRQRDRHRNRQSGPRPRDRRHLRLFGQTNGGTGSGCVDRSL